MKTKFFYSMILAGGLIFACSTVSLNAQTTTKTTTEKTTTKTTKKVPEVMYTCPEHPDYVSNKPGKCPKCGMALVVKKDMKKGKMMKKETTKEKTTKETAKPM